MNYFWTMWATGLVVCLLWAFVEYCNNDVPQICYDAARVVPKFFYLLAVLYFLLWPASLVLIVERAWQVKKERDQQ